MIISKYLKKHQLTQNEFAAKIHITQGMVYQYINNIRPVSEKVCVRIEHLTQGELNRKNLRPNDWPDIWPELKNITFPNSLDI